MEKKTAAIIGSTGLIGSWLQKYLLEDEDYATVRSLVRWPSEPVTAKHEVRLVDFNDAESIGLALNNVSVVYCAIGTTNKKVKGDKKLYWQIDHDIPVRVCKMAVEAGCKQFAIVSSVGANSKSSNFYLGLKGNMEEDIIATAMPGIYIMQPGQLLGKRNENRPMEAMIQGLTKSISGILSGSWSKYKSINASDVARAMIAAVKKDKTGVHRYTYTEMMELLKK